MEPDSTPMHTNATDGHSSRGDSDDGGVESDVSSLTSAEELPDALTTDDDSDMNSDIEIVWAKGARGVWGMGHS